MAVDRRALALALATAIAIPAEGVRRVAYYDPPGILTVCYGHTGSDVVKGKVYSLEQCKTLLSADMLKAIDTVERCHPGLPENVLAAFADGGYNVGAVLPCNSTASKYLSAGNYVAACNELLRWDKAHVAGFLVTLPGLTARRERERDLCLTPQGATP